MKKRIIGIILVFVIAISVVVPVTASAATSTNAMRLKEYILANGSLNSSNMRYISYTNSEKTIDAIVICSTENEFVFRFVNSTDSYHSVVSFTFDTTNPSQTLKITNMFIGSSVWCGYTSYVNLSPVDISDTATYTFSITENYYGYGSQTMSQSDVQSLSNSSLRLAKTAWDLLLTVSIGCTLNDLAKTVTVQDFDEYEVESNDSQASAMPITFGTIYKGEIGKKSSDKDFYSIDLVAAREYRIYVGNYCNAFDETTLLIHLIKPDGESTSINFYMSKDGVDYYDFTAKITGKYYVEFYNYSNRNEPAKYYYLSVVDRHKHSFGSVWNCDENTHWYECVCGEKSSVQNHVYDNNCDTTCNICGKTRVTTHSWGSGVVTQKPTCTDTGVMTYTCTSCNQTKTETISKVPHSYQDVWSADGTSHYHKCETCSDQKDVTPHTWDDGVITKKSSCFGVGEKTYTCTECNATKTESVAKVAHTYENGICTVCGDWQYKSAVLKLGKATNQNGSVKLTWSAVTGATGYIVYRKAGSATSWSKLATVTSLSYVDKNVKTGTKYTYTVKAVCNKVNGKYNTTGVATYYLAQPAAKVVNQDGSVKVNWAKITGAKQYIVYRKAGSATSWTKLATVTTNTYVDANVKGGTNYKYTVVAVNGNYKSTYNNTGAAIKYLAQPTLGTPVSAKAGVTVKWSKVTGATGYIVYRKTGSGSWVKLATVTGNAKVSYLDKTAKKDTTYKYTVKAYYGSYYSAYNTKGVTIKDKY